ncbi:type VI secretion system baseplate subunit TssF [Chondromyces apiculatus]|uniref:Protein ImpG/VasA n=1 Tax=Chondromyces apiculatus DSM 436 TaxID=1192034 RepID=A0A017T0W5_9BACT|nr:type VI secretion system baseplate subunit TssF [Chondromyces apiculatus]EYF02868.1 Protein ImpG/VasA [Chondromyces apiculatus DSM 436]
MSTAHNDAELLDLYARELAYLRERGAEFSAAYPKIAPRLGLEGRHCSDPHVERLLESFAFLTARLQHRLDSDLPELTTALLGVLYPPLQSPVPSMAIAAFDVKPKDSKLTSGLVIERHTPLFAEARGGPTCRFRTCYPVTLWPIAVESAGFTAPEKLDLPSGASGVMAALQLQLRSGGPPLRALGPTRLRFYLNAGGMVGYRLYELLFGHTLRVLVADAEGRPVGEARLHPVGFGADEDALPYPTHAHAGHRWLQEYFAFPEKFLFCDVELGALPEGAAMQILFLLDRRPPASLVVRADTFQLGCTPIINLFPRTTEPIRVDGRFPEYRLVPDARRERTTEIHSILRVTATAPGEAEQIDYAPFFSFSHHREGAGPRAFWHARRVATDREEVPGTDVFLSFVDTTFSPAQPPSRAVYASVLCTNRDLPEEMSAGVRLQPERGAAVGTISCLTKPTPQRDPPLAGQALWRLVSNLSLNHLSLSGPSGLDALREILRVYLPDQIPDAERQIQGIAAVSARTVARRTGPDAWRGFCRGTEVTLTFDEEQFVGQSPLLFAEVLGRFLSLYAHINTFTELVLKSTAREEVWKRWPPMAGARPLL